MSVAFGPIADKLVAYLAVGDAPGAQEKALGVLRALQPSELPPIQRLYKSTIQSLSAGSRAPVDWLKLLCTLLEAPPTRQSAFLDTIQFVQADMFHDRTRYHCLAELHTACGHYSSNAKKQIQEATALIAAILTPSERSFGSAGGMQPSEGCLALIDLISTLISGKRDVNANAVPGVAQNSLLLAPGDFMAKTTLPRPALIDFVIDFNFHVALIPAIINILMETPLSQSQSRRLAINIKSVLSKKLASSTAGGGGISLIPSWIISSIVKSCFHFIQLAYVSQSTGGTLSKEKSVSFTDVSDIVSEWVTLIRFCTEMAILPWTAKSSHRKGVAADPILSKQVDSSSDFDPSLIICLLDLQIRQSFDIFVSVLNHFAHMLDDNAVFETRQTEFLEVKAPFSCADLLLLVLLVHCTPYQQATLKLLLEIVGRLLERRPMAHNQQMARDVAKIPGMEPHSHVLLKLALHCSESVTYQRLNQLGASRISEFYMFAKELLCSIFIEHENSRRDVLAFCFAAPSVAPAHILRYKQERIILLSMYNDMTSSTLEWLVNHHAILLRPLLKVILEFLPYLTSSENPDPSSRLFVAMLPLIRLDKSFQDTIVMLIKKLTTTRAITSCDLAFHAISSLVSRQLVSHELQEELFDVLLRSSRLSMSIRQHLYAALFSLSEKTFLAFASRKDNNADLCLNLFQFVRATVLRYWSIEDEVAEFHYLSFVEAPSRSSPEITLAESPDNVFLLLVFACMIFGRLLAQWAEAGHVERSDKDSRVHQLGMQLVVILISALNQFGSVSYAAFGVLGIATTQLSQLKKKILALEDRFAALRLTYPALSDGSIAGNDSTHMQVDSEQAMLDEILQGSTEAAVEHSNNNIFASLSQAGIGLSPIYRGRMSVLQKIQLTSGPYLMAAEVLLDEGRAISRGASSFLVCNETSTLSLALTKAMCLLDMRSSLTAYVHYSVTARDISLLDPEKTTDRASPHSDPSSLEPPFPIPPCTMLSIDSILMILRRFTLPEVLSDAQLDDRVALTFLPKPTLTVLNETLLTLCLQLRDYVQSIDTFKTDHRVEELHEEQGKFIFDFVNKRWPFSKRPVIQELIKLVYSVQLILLSAISDSELPDDVSMPELLLLLPTKNSYSFVATAMTSAKSLILDTFRHIFAIAGHMKWDLDSLIAGRPERQILPQDDELSLVNFFSSSSAPSAGKKRPNQKPSESLAPNAKKRKEVASLPLILEEENNDLAQLASPAGDICLYFTNQLLSEIESVPPASINSAMLSQYTALLAALGRADKTKDGATFTARSCDLILEALCRRSYPHPSIFTVLLNHVLEIHPDQATATALAGFIIERCLSKQEDITPRVRQAKLEIELISKVQNLKINETEQCRDAALELALAKCFALEMSGATSSFDSWLLHGPQHGLISLALRKMAISKVAVKTSRIWMHYIALCTKMMATAKNFVYRLHRQGVPVLTSILAADNGGNFEDESKWANEGWFTSLIALGGFIKRVAKRIAPSLSTSQEHRLAVLVAQVGAFEVACRKLSNRFKPTERPLIERALLSDTGKKSRTAGKETTQRVPQGGQGQGQTSGENDGSDEDGDEDGWDSEIGSEDDEIQLNSRRRRRMQPLRSANPFIDEALREEEFFFQEGDDDYADLEDWIDTTDM